MYQVQMVRKIIKSVLFDVGEHKGLCFTFSNGSCAFLYFPLCVPPVFLDLHRHRSLPFVHCTPIQGLFSWGFCDSPDNREASVLFPALLSGPMESTKILALRVRVPGETPLLFSLKMVLSPCNQFMSFIELYIFSYYFVEPFFHPSFFASPTRS